MVPRLLQAGHKVRVLVRDPDRLGGRDWLDRVDVVKGDVLAGETLPPAMRDVEAAYYLVHSLGGGKGYEERDVAAAEAFGNAAREAGVKRLLYLGGIVREKQNLSQHLRSRGETGDALRRTGLPVTEFRAGVIVGSGSLSFEMIRYLTERVPVMICPKWVQTRAQPIGIRDVLEYLATALEVPECIGRIIEIGGADIVTYGEMMMGYAKARGLRRRMVRVPVLTPRLSSYWVDLVTPIPAAIARPLIQGLGNEVVVEDDTARELFPGIQPASYGESLQRALARLDAGAVETAWLDAAGNQSAHPPAVEVTAREGLIVEQRRREVNASPDAVFRVFTGIGGKRGWYHMNFAWRVRGAIDRMVGGVGLRRGRRDPDHLRPGDALDFWRVERVEPNRSLRLRAEMKVPGKAWLEFRVEPREQGCLLTQTAMFAPKGLWGLSYWYLLYPVHAYIFSGMCRKIARRSENESP